MIFSHFSIKNMQWQFDLLKFIKYFCSYLYSESPKLKLMSHRYPNLKIISANDFLMCSQNITHIN